MKPIAMKLVTRTLVTTLMLIVLSSCYTMKNLMKDSKPFTDEFLSTIEPGKRYDFKLKTGQTQTIYVTGVADLIINGFYYQPASKGKKAKSDYSASFDSIKENVTEIHVRKFSPVLTAAACVVATTLAIIVIVESVDNISIGY